jgi:site-specific DNA-cytosine methylase
VVLRVSQIRALARQVIPALVWCPGNPRREPWQENPSHQTAACQWPTRDRTCGDNYLTAGHYGVTRWTEPSGAISASGQHDNGRWSIADPRELPTCAISQTDGLALPAAGDRMIARITALDGTWHRPFTTLELAALQSLIEPEEYLELDGLSDQDWRERIGNAVPSAAAEAIASVMGTTLLLAWSGETFTLSSQAIWVRPVAIALSLAQGESA